MPSGLAPYRDLGANGGAARTDTGPDTGDSTRLDTRPTTRPGGGNVTGAGVSAGSSAGLSTGSDTGPGCGSSSVGAFRCPLPGGDERIGATGVTLGTEAHRPPRSGVRRGRSAHVGSGGTLVPPSGQVVMSTLFPARSRSSATLRSIEAIDLRHGCGQPCRSPMDPIVKTAVAPPCRTTQSSTPVGGQKRSPALFAHARPPGSTIPTNPPGNVRIDRLVTTGIRVIPLAHEMQASAQSNSLDHSGRKCPP